MLQKIKSNLPKNLLVRQSQSRVQPSRHAQNLYNKFATAKIDSLLLAKDNKIKTKLYRYSPKDRHNEVGLSAFYGTQIKFKPKYPMRYTSFSNREESKGQSQQLEEQPITPLDFLNADFNNRFRHLVDSERYRYLTNGISELKRVSKLTDLKLEVDHVSCHEQNKIGQLKIDQKVIQNIRGVHRSHLLKRQQDLKIKLGREISVEGYSSPKIVNLSYDFRPMRQTGQALSPGKSRLENRFQNNFKNKSKLQKKYRNRQIDDELEFQIQLIERDEFKIKDLIEKAFKNDNNCKPN